MQYDIKPLTEEEADLISEKLGEYLESTVPSQPGTPEEEQLIFIIRNDKSDIIAGCIVNIHEWGRAVLATLWTDERYRNQGLASMLIREAERTVKEKGCHIMCLGTMDFMARPLYEKHGYKVFSVRGDYPKGHEGWSLAKHLDLGIPDYVPSNNIAASLYTVECGTKEDGKIIVDGIGDYSAVYIPEKHDDITLGRKLVDEDGNLIAGILGEIDGWNGCDIDVLWVEEPYRNRGLGSFLLREFENEAIKNGAYNVFSSAGDWNVDFFRKNGFAIHGELEDYPKGHSAYELGKRL